MSGAEHKEQQQSAGRRADVLTNELLLELISSQLRFERRVMNQLEQLQASVADLTAAQANATAKVDMLLQKNDLLLDLADSLEKQVVALGEAGQLPTAALSDLIASIDGAKTAYNAIGDKATAEGVKIDAEIAADMPPPAPAPADPVEPARRSGSGGKPDRNPVIRARRLRGAA